MPEDSDDGGGLQHYGGLLEFHLRRHGTRPDGSPERQGKLWQYEAFAAEAGLASRSIRDYRSGKPPSAETQNRIERALFGDNPAYDNWRARLREAAHAAKQETEPQDDGTISGVFQAAERGPSSEWEILKGHRTDGVAEVLLHRPFPANLPNTFYIHATVRLGVGEYDFDNRTVLIGLRQVFLSVNSESYQVSANSMIGERVEHPYLKPDVGGVTIVGPCDESGRITGNPLGEEHVAIIEPTGGEEPVVLSLHAGQHRFDVTDITSQPLRDLQPTNKKAILDAIVRDGCERDRQNRVVVARARMQRSSEK